MNNSIPDNPWTHVYALTEPYPKAKDVPPYGHVDRDGLDLIESLKRMPARRRARLLTIYAFISLTATGGSKKYKDDGDDEPHQKSRLTIWGAKAVNEWIGLDVHTTSKYIRELERLKFSDGEPLLTVINRTKTIVVRSPSRRNTFKIPLTFRLRDNQVRGSSLLEKMFAGDENVYTKMQRFLLMMRIYSDFDPHKMICQESLFVKVEPNPDYEEYEEILELGFCNRHVNVSPSLSVWGYPRPSMRSDSRYLEALYTSIEWLGINGYASTIRAVSDGKGVMYIASYGSKYYREKYGNFQAIRSIYGEDEYGDPVWSPDAPEIMFEFEQEDEPVLYGGGDLYESIIPQYIHLGDTLKNTVGGFLVEMDNMREEILDYAEHA